MRSTGLLLVCSGVLGLFGCDDSAAARPQLLVVILSDLPTTGQARDDDRWSRDAAIDSVRIEVQSADGSTADDGARILLAPEKDDWPISFGLDPSKLPAGQSIRIRIRAFRSDRAAAGTQNGAATLDPVSTTAVDRLVDLDRPTAGVLKKYVVLRGACMGAPTTFGSDAKTCVDAGDVGGSPMSGIAEADPGVAVGSWTPTVARACSAEKPALASEAICIPGGFTVLGDANLAGIAAQTTVDAVPLTPVVLDPFYLDETEFTVGRLRALVNDHGYAGALPATRTQPKDYITAEDRPFCSWVDDLTDDSRDDQPLNCVPQSIAADLCKLAGGALPSEAQWEHAARGRGEGRVYPWGSEAPDCQRTCAARSETSSGGAACRGGFDAAGVHPADRSRDGVLDLGGSLREATLDLIAPLSCLRPSGMPVPTNPTCPVATTGTPPKAITTNTALGGSCILDFADLESAFRRKYVASADSGFRCAYPGVD